LAGNKYPLMLVTGVGDDEWLKSSDNIKFNGWDKCLHDALAGDGFINIQTLNFRPIIF
jgi:hypothetical protein